MDFRLAGENKPIIIVEAEVNGKGPFDFAVDTGASMTVLSNETAQKLGITATPSPPKKGFCCEGIGVTASLASVESLRIGDTEAEKIQVALMDITGISKAVGTELAGIIGYNFMEKYRVIVDYPHQKIFFEKASDPVETRE